jgi:hypothetical protein
MKELILLFAATLCSAEAAPLKKVFYEATTTNISNYSKPHGDCCGSFSKTFYTKADKPRLPGLQYIENNPSRPFFFGADGFGLELVSRDLVALENLVCDKNECDFKVANWVNAAWRRYQAPGKDLMKALTLYNWGLNEKREDFAAADRKEAYEKMRRLISADPAGYKKTKTLICGNSFYHNSDNIHNSRTHGSSTTRSAYLCYWADAADLATFKKMQPRESILKINGRPIESRNSLPTELYNPKHRRDESQYFPLKVVDTLRLDFTLFERIPGVDIDGRNTIDDIELGSFSLFNEKNENGDESLFASEFGAWRESGGSYEGSYSPLQLQLLRPMSAKSLNKFFGGWFNSSVNLIGNYTKLMNSENSKNLWVRFSRSAPFQTMEIEYPYGAETEFSLQSIFLDCRDSGQSEYFVYCPVTVKRR